MEAKIEKGTRCVTAQVPMGLWRQLDAYGQKHPGLSRSQLIIAMISAGLAAPDKVKEHVGRY